jgi:protein-tyrosine phosphatase
MNKDDEFKPRIVDGVPQIYGHGEYEYTDISMIVPGLLWLGNIEASKDTELLKKEGITTVINTSTGGLIHSNDGINRIWHPLLDGPGNNQKQMDDAINDVVTLIKNKVPTLVHCRAGVSRSATVLCAAFALTNEPPITFDQARDVIIKIRPCINPHYALRQLARWHMKEIDDKNPY